MRKKKTKGEDNEVGSRYITGKKVSKANSSPKTLLTNKINNNILKILK